ncbi:MAG TPA: YdaS family helix-turn-helix protein [Gammaproteobacteria bacterium]|nr:YdaS family helix-turn-helix protein [Gammaproteobacteria bacterium]
MNGVSEAIRILGLQGLAKRIGVTYQAVRKWEREGAPAERVIPIVHATNGQVRPYDLRPDLYPDPEWMPPAAEPGPSGDEHAA